MKHTNMQKDHSSKYFSPENPSVSVKIVSRKTTSVKMDEKRKGFVILLTGRGQRIKT